jgi:hypothetical protein
MDDAGGWLWFFVDVILVGALGVAMGYGIAAWRRRPKDPALEKVRDDATRRGYRDE